MVTSDWLPGDHTGLSFPAHSAALREGGRAFLNKAFQASGILAADNAVVSIDRCQEVSGGSTGRKMLLDVTYRTRGSDLCTNLFVKFSRDFDDPVRDRGRTQMESEVKFAGLSLAPDFPITVPRTQFADYHRNSGTGLMISERIIFGINGIERQHHKCLDYEMDRPADHYRALLTAIARLAGAHRAGRLPPSLVDQFPVDLSAATVGESPRLTPEKLQLRIAQLTEFATSNTGLLPENVRSPDFLRGLATDAPLIMENESGIWRYLSDASDHIALSHWNANVDNAWFWTDADDVLQCGLMDWGCVSQLNVAMAIWGALSAAETSLWDGHFDALLQIFCDEVHRSGAVQLDPAELARQVRLYAVLMGTTWLLDVPALIRARLPDSGPQTTRMDPRIRDDEGVRVPLQMLINVLNLWESRGVDDGLALL